MGNKQSNTVIKSTLNGAYHKDNFIWGGAMNICWQTLESQIIKAPLLLKVQSEVAQQMIKNFHNSPFSTKDLSEDSYYTKAGFGQQALKTINKECKEKFPDKSFSDIEMRLKDNDIVTYAYFVKEVQYLNPFAVQPALLWNNTTFVKGFKAESEQHKNNIQVCKYTNENEFVIKLLLKQENEELFVVKGYDKSLPQDIVTLVNQRANVSDTLRHKEEFEMPRIELDVKREYKELIKAPLLNKGFEKHLVAAMFENIKFKIDEVGAKVENQAFGMEWLTCEHKTRKFIVDRPFWVVMRQKECHPCFIVQMNNAEFMQKGE